MSKITVQLFRLALALFLMASFFLSWSQPHQVPHSENHIVSKNESYTQFAAIVVAEPDVRISHAKLIVETFDYDGRVLVNVPLYPGYRYGDVLEVSCMLQAPKKFDDFDYPRYLARRGIYSLCWFPRVNIISSDHGNVALKYIFNFKSTLQKNIDTNLPEPQAGLLSAMLLGVRKDIPSEIIEQFSVAGMIHVMAISGLHITIVSTLVLQLLIRIGLYRRQAFWLATILLFLYVIMIGFPSSAVRAGIMGFLVMFAMHLGRLSNVINSILFAAAIMTIFNLNILHEIGFQLSFVAVIGIVYFLPYFEKWLQIIPGSFGMRSVLGMSLSAQLATTPLVIFYFGRVSVVGLLANILIVPLLPYVMIAGFVALVLSFIFESLTWLFFWPVYFLLRYITEVVLLFSYIPYAAISI